MLFLAYAGAVASHSIPRRRAKAGLEWVAKAKTIFEQKIISNFPNPIIDTFPSCVTCDNMKPQICELRYGLKLDTFAFQEYF